MEHPALAMQGRDSMNPCDMALVRSACSLADSTTCDPPVVFLVAALWNAAMIGLSATEQAMLPTRTVGPKMALPDPRAIGTYLLTRFHAPASTSP